MLTAVKKRSDQYLKDGKRQFSVMGTVELVERLDELAAERRWTRSVLISDVLEKFAAGQLVEKSA